MKASKRFHQEVIELPKDRLLRVANNVVQQYINSGMNVLAPTLRKHTGYRLQLGNGQRWQVTATEGIRSWVDKLASIMELEKCDRDEYPKLIIVRRKTDLQRWVGPKLLSDRNKQEELERRGWNALELPDITIWSHQEVQDVICEIGNEDGYELDIIRKLLVLYPIFDRAVCSGGIPFHAALINRYGVGVLLAAPGNIGKSTCCRRITYPWLVSCDDETLVISDKEMRYLAHPLPTWSDYLLKRSKRTWNVQRYVPLSAIFFLEQSESEDVIPLGQGKAAVLMNDSATQVCRRYWNNLVGEELITRRKMLFHNACNLARAVPAYKLLVKLNGQFWEKIEAVLPE